MRIDLIWAFFMALIVVGLGYKFVLNDVTASLKGKKESNTNNPPDNSKKRYGSRRRCHIGYV